MTKTLLLAVTYIGVTVDSLFTSEFPVVEGGVVDRKPLPFRSAFSVFELFLMDDWNRSLTLFFFLFTSFFGSRFARTMNCFVILCPFFFFYLFLYFGQN